jgi:hypothetical protein
MEDYPTQPAPVELEPVTEIAAAIADTEATDNDIDKVTGELVVTAAAEAEGTDSKQMDRYHRRALLLKGTDAISEILEVDVTIPRLSIAAKQGSNQLLKLTAKRALRCLGEIGRPNSPLMSQFGEVDIYHIAEAVVVYGASDATYLKLSTEYGLCAEEVTSIYALRGEIADHTDGKMPSFPQMEQALTMVGLSFSDAASDHETAMRIFDEAGFISEGSTFWSYLTVRFAPTATNQRFRVIEAAEDPDGSISAGILERYDVDTDGEPADLDAIERDLKEYLG